MAERIGVKIRYFAQLKDERGCEEESLQTSTGDAAALFRELSATHGFTLDPQNLRVAVNDEFVDWHHDLNDGDTIVYIPPVAGG